MMKALHKQMEIFFVVLSRRKIFTHSTCGT